RAGLFFMDSGGRSPQQGALSKEGRSSSMALFARELRGGPLARECYRAQTPASSMVYAAVPGTACPEHLLDWSVTDEPRSSLSQKFRWLGRSQSPGTGQLWSDLTSRSRDQSC